MTFMVALMFAILAVHIANSQALYFVRKSSLCVQDPIGATERVICSVGQPPLKHTTDFALSPDGTALAFTEDGPETNTVVRYIGVYNIATKTKTILANTPRRNGFGPQWSPDGSTIAFQAMYESKSAHGLTWGLAMAPKDLHDCAMTSGTNVENDKDIWAFTWFPDGTKLLAMHSTAVGESLLTFTSTGKLAGSESLPISTPADTELSVSSASQFSISPNGRYIAIVVSVYDAGYANFEALYEDGGYGALFVIDREAHKATRVSPRTYAVFFSKPVWFPDSEHLVVCGINASRPLKSHAKVQSSAYKMSRTSPDITILARDAEGAFLVMK
jgi:Tol biopolymer transport system component